MAIVTFQPMMNAGSRGASLNVGQGKAYTQRFLVITNSKSDGPASIISQMGYFYGQKYIIGYPGGGTDADFNSYLTGIDVDQVGEDGLQWEVTFNYSWYDANTIGGGPQQNPLLMPIEVSWNWRDYELVIAQDINGDAVLNTAGDPYDPPVLINDPRLGMTVVRNEASISIGLIQQYRNAINSDPWAGFDPFFAHCLSITPKNTFHQLVGWYYQVTYEFEFITPRQAAGAPAGGESSGFRFLIFNQGQRAISSVTGKLYHVTVRGIPVSEPVALDQNGFWSNTPNFKPIFNTVQAYVELPFTQAFNFDPLAITGQRSGFNSPGGIPG